MCHQSAKTDETYALIQKDYHTSVHGKPAPYKRSSVLDDLGEVLRTSQPIEIYLTDETDGHIDHRAAFWFFRDAARQVGYKAPSVVRITCDLNPITNPMGDVATAT